jgi:acyl-CoA thioesterase I
MTKLRTCFIGDSITNGTGDTTLLGWPGHLCQAETDAGHDITYYDLGIRGDTSADMLPRWQAEVEARLPAVLNCAIIFNFGLNDATEQDGGIRVPLGDSIRNARAMLGSAKTMHTTLWVGPSPVDDSKMPLMTDTGETRDKRNARTADYNLAFRALADELQIPYLDMLSALINDSSWPGRLADGLHPAPEGHRKMAQIVGDWEAWRNIVDGY